MAVTDLAIDGIREMILSGELGPGDRLPPEKELGERLGLSRSSLREAVRALEVMNVLSVRRGDGTYVTTLEPALLLEALTFVVDLHQDRSLLELFEVRRILEPAATVLGMRAIDGAQLDSLRTLLDGVDETTPVADLVAHDLEFHRRLVAGSDNAYLESLLSALSTRTARARIWRGLTEERSIARTLSEHRAILDAIERRDPALVLGLTTAHVSGVEAWLRRST